MQVIPKSLLVTQKGQMEVVQLNKMPCNVELISYQNCLNTHVIYPLSRNILNYFFGRVQIAKNRLFRGYGMYDRGLRK